MSSQLVVFCDVKFCKFASCESGQCSVIAAPQGVRGCMLPCISPCSISCLCDKVCVMCQKCHLIGCRSLVIPSRHVPVIVKQPTAAKC